MKAKVSQIITALFELQDKGYFDISLSYEENRFQARIYRGKTDEYPMYQAYIDLTSDVESKLDEVFKIVEALKAVPTKDTNSVMITYFQCYSREFVPGEKSGEWIKRPPVIEYAGNATQLMLIDGSGYYIDDPDNGMHAQEHAKMDYLLKDRLPEFFTEMVIEELQETYGLNNLKTYYSLSNCQGDGLCLYGHITGSELFENEKFRKIAFAGIHHRQIQSVYNVLQNIDFEHSSRYYYAKTVLIDGHYYDDATDSQEEIIARIICNVKAWYNAFCRDWEKRGYNYFYEISDSEMKEACNEFDCYFTEKGKFINIDEYEEYRKA